MNLNYYDYTTEHGVILAKTKTFDLQKRPLLIKPTPAELAKLGDVNVQRLSQEKDSSFGRNHSVS